MRPHSYDRSLSFVQSVYVSIDAARACFHKFIRKSPFEICTMANPPDDESDPSLMRSQNVETASAHFSMKTASTIALRNRDLNASCGCSPHISLIGLCTKMLQKKRPLTSETDILLMIIGVSIRVLVFVLQMSCYPLISKRLAIYAFFSHIRLSI